MEAVPRDGEAVHFGAGYLDAFLVHGVIDFAGDGQAGRGRGCGNQLDHRQPAGQGPATPRRRRGIGC